MTLYDIQYAMNFEEDPPIYPSYKIRADQGEDIEEKAQTLAEKLTQAMNSHAGLISMTVENMTPIADEESETSAA